LDQHRRQLPAHAPIGSEDFFQLRFQRLECVAKKKPVLRPVAAAMFLHARRLA
jgi:hypothetical protein